MHLFAWTNGELLIWMGTDRGHGLEPIAKTCEGDFGVKVKLEAPEPRTSKMTVSRPWRHVWIVCIFRSSDSLMDGGVQIEPPAEE